MNIVIIEDEPKIADSLKSILMEIDSSYTVLKMLSSVKKFSRMVKRKSIKL